MLTDIFISYSWWALLLVGVIGIFYATLLYYRNPNSKLNSVISVILFILRFLGVSLLAFLLLSPFIRTKHKVIERPLVVVGVDNSSSVGLSSKGSEYMVEIGKQIFDFKNKLVDKADVDIFSFGDDVLPYDSLTYNVNISDYSKFLSFVRSNYSGQNVASILIIGDGIVNSGVDPVFSASDLNWNINTVALGDTIKSADVEILDVRYNSIAYADDVFPIEVSLSATGLSGKKSSVRILENGVEIAKENIIINADDYQETKTFNVIARETGKRRFRIVVEKVDSELITQNNYSDVFIDVLNNRLKILLLGDVPHPDLGAIKQSLDRNPNINVELEYISSMTGDVSDYDILMLYQVPGIKGPGYNKIRSFVDSEIPILYFVGENTSFNLFNEFNSGLKIVWSGVTDIAFISRDDNFSRFSFSDELSEQLESYPPLSVPVANYILREGTDVFASQKIGDIKTDFPMMLFFSDLSKRSAVFVGEGYWLWRIQSIVRYGNTDAFDALLSKTVMFLTADVDKRRLRIRSEGDYENRNNVVIWAEYFNESMEPDNSKEIELTLTNENNEDFEYLFTSQNDGYVLDLRRLPVGVYRYKVTVADDSGLIETGNFTVSELNIESADLQADHRMLTRLAIDHEGKVYRVDQITLVADDIINSGLQSKVHFEESIINLVSLWPLLVVILLIFSVEWFLRKYFGSY